MANRPIYPDTIKNVGLIVENADGTTAQDLITAGANGSRIDSIAVTSDDTSAVILVVNYNDGSTDHVIAQITIPAASGTDGATPPVSLLNAVDMPFLGEDLSFYLEATDKITIAAKVAVTAAKKVTLVATYGNY